MSCIFSLKIKQAICICLWGMSSQIQGEIKPSFAWIEYLVINYWLYTLIHIWLVSSCNIHETFQNDMLSLSSNVLFIWARVPYLFPNWHDIFLHLELQGWNKVLFTINKSYRFRVISKLTWNFASLTLWRLQLVIVAYWDGGLAGWTNVWESWGLEVGISWISYSLECPSFNTPCLYNSIIEGLTTNIIQSNIDSGFFSFLL